MAPLVNGEEGWVEIVLDRPRRIKFTFDAVSTVEAVLQMSFGEACTKIAQARILRALLWAGLLHDDARLRKEGSGAIISIGQWIERYAPGSGMLKKCEFIMEKLNPAIALYYYGPEGPPPDEEEDGKKKYTPEILRPSPATGELPAPSPSVNSG